MTEQTNAYFRALEQASNESPITDGKHRAYIAWFNSFRNQSSAFEVDDLPWPRDIHEFVETIRAAGVIEFAVTDRSTGLMEGLHKLTADGLHHAGALHSNPERIPLGRRWHRRVPGNPFPRLTQPATRRATALLVAYTHKRRF